MHLLKTFCHVGQIPDAESYHGRVKTIVRKGDILSIALHPKDAFAQRASSNILPADGHHCSVNVINNHFASRANARGCKTGQITGATANIEDPVTVFQGKQSYCFPFPHMLNAKTEQRIHEIVFLRHPVKMPDDGFQLFIFAIGFKAVPDLSRPVDMIIQLLDSFFRVIPFGIFPKGHGSNLSLRTPVAKLH